MDVPVVGVGGDFVKKLTVVPTSVSSMLLGTGYLEAERRHVLLPYVEIKIAGVEQSRLTEDLPEEEYDEIFSHILPFENAMFLAYDLVRDMRIACSRLRTLATGSLAMEPARLSYARRFAENLRGEAELCVAAIDELVEGAEEAALPARAAASPDDGADDPDPAPKRGRRRRVAS